MCRFLAGDDREAEQRRHRSFKLIPSVVHGSWVIKQSVGNTPVMLGKKLTTKYFRWVSPNSSNAGVGMVTKAPEKLWVRHQQQSSHSLLAQQKKVMLWFKTA